MRLLIVAAASFVLGVIVAGVAFAVFSSDAIDNAVRETRDKIGGKIPAALGRDTDPCESLEVLFSAKGESVIVVTRNGVKTLRLCCDGTEPKPAQ